MASTAVDRRASASTDTVTFPAGSLIIPMQSYFQTSCGTVSAYGLIWRILQSNQPGHYNALHPVTVYGVINPGKTSPNRCVPSNKNTPPLPNLPGPSGDLTHWDDPAWNDGCDASIHNDTQMPVVQVNPAIPYPLSGQYPVGPLTVFDTTSLTYTHNDSTGSTVFPYAQPAYSAMTLDDSTTPPLPRFTTVQYLGGPFVIDASDSANVVNFLQSGDSYVPASKLAPFITNTGCGTIADETNHFVYMHQATVGFTAAVAKRMTKTPPRVAVLRTGVGQKDISLYRAGVNVLVSYLKIAGLYYSGTPDHTDSGGCPLGTFSGCTLNGSTSTTQYPGEIYDEYSAYEDTCSTSANPQGLLNANGSPSNLWVPHWRYDDNRNYITGATVSPFPPVYSQCINPGDGSAGNTILNSLNNINYFLNKPGHGLMAQCASIATFEGGMNSWQFMPMAQKQSELLFSITDGSAYGTYVNAPTESYTGAFWGRNCSDPDYQVLKSGNCMVWPNPTISFAQVGDFTFVSQEGSVNTFTNRPGGSVYDEGVVRLAVTWTNFNPGDYPSKITSNLDGNDVFDFRFKDNDPKKGEIVYVGGHEYGESTVGSRIVLNTLFNLGSDPTGPQRAIAAPVAYDDPNGNDAMGTRALFFSPLFVPLQNVSTVQTQFTPAAPSQWLFPITQGDLLVHNVLGLVAGESNFTDGVLANANAALPPNNKRNIFTVLGSRVVTNPVTLGGGQTLFGVGLPSGALYPVPFNYTEINSDFSKIPNTKCNDRLHLTRALDGTCTLDVGGDGICDLQEALELTSLPKFLDCGALEGPAIQAALAPDVPLAQGLVQMTRGYCYATTTGSDNSGTFIPEPANTDCNAIGANNKATLGGMIHSGPAIVPPDPVVADLGAPRPTVALAGGWDGQLHCFYVSGGSGYTGSANVPLTPDNASTVFATDWSAQFAAKSTPPMMTELWSFIPPGQLPLLRNNIAKLDAPPLVMRAFIDPDSTGIRKNRTLAAVASGPTGRDITVIDITNPLKPRILWTWQSTLLQPGGYPWYSTAPINNLDIGGTLTYLWNEKLAQGYRTLPAIDLGGTPTGLFNFTDMGGVTGITGIQLRAGMEPVYAAVMASSLSEKSLISSKGLLVTSIRVDYGQKLCQFLRPYANALVDNTPPVQPLAISGGNGVELLAVGDMEGRAWLLNASNCTNALLDPGCADPSCQYAAFDAGATSPNFQPISAMALAMVPPDATGVFAPYAGTRVLVLGTGGADWAPSTAKGTVHVLPFEKQFRVPYQAGGKHLDGTPWAVADARTFAHAKGALQEASSAFPIVLAAGERVYGLMVSGSTLFVTTALSPQGDPKKLQGNVAGNLYTLDLRTATSSAMTALPITYASYGNVTVLGRSNGTTSTDYIYASEVSRQYLLRQNNAGASGAATPNSAYNVVNNGVFSRLMAWLQRFLRS